MEILDDVSTRSHLFVAHISTVVSIWQLATAPGGGGTRSETDGGVPLATENWTQKDRGKNGIWGQKDRIL